MDKTEMIKRRDLERHLREHGCHPLREGEHQVWLNPRNGRTAPVPRHREIDNATAARICDMLGIPRITKR